MKCSLDSNIAVSYQCLLGRMLQSLQNNATTVCSFVISHLDTSQQNDGLQHQNNRDHDHCSCDLCELCPVATHK